MSNCSLLDGVLFEGSAGASDKIGVEGLNVLSKGFLTKCWGVHHHCPQIQVRA